MSVFFPVKTSYWPRKRVHSRGGGRETCPPHITKGGDTVWNISLTHTFRDWSCKIEPIPQFKEKIQNRSKSLYLIKVIDDFSLKFIILFDSVATLDRRIVGQIVHVHYSKKLEEHGYVITFKRYCINRKHQGRVICIPGVAYCTLSSTGQSNVKSSMSSRTWGLGHP